jgi:hypothetical protein
MLWFARRYLTLNGAITPINMTQVYAKRFANGADFLGFPLKCSRFSPEV